MSPSSEAPDLDGDRFEPGTRTRLELPVARLTTGNIVALPVEVVRGVEDGPALWLSAAIHGDELDGVEVIRRVLGGLRPDRLSGTLYALPVVNVFGFIGESRYLPDRRDLNRSFPGSAKGSMASRLANLFMTQIVERCAWGIDLHCGSDDRENLPQVRADLDDAETRRLARAFGTPLMVHSKPPDGSLRRAAVKAGARVVVFEGGEAGRFNSVSIAAGEIGVGNALRELGMLDPDTGTDAAPGDGGRTPDEPVIARKTRWVRAPRAGICRIVVELGERVKRDRTLAVITDALGAEEHTVRSRRAGLVIGRRVKPLVYQGEALVHIAEPEA